jgi:predicted O-methyltransferase YrrM
MLFSDSDPIYQYCASFTQKPPDLYQALERETFLKTLHPQMIAGHLQGRFLSMISHMISPKNILEIGTFTGYSALCLAEGLQENGKIYTIESNIELKHILDKFLGESPLASKINCLFGDALTIISELDIEFDLVWIDAAKVQYKDYFHLCIDKLGSGGFILADNVLWDGKVIKENQDAETEAIKQFNLMIREDNRVEQVILPFRDGINMMRKI